jgi:ribosomal protein L11 methylase PrmA
MNELMAARQALPSSFRDPSGFMILDQGIYKRVVTARGAGDYDAYVTSGLHRELAAAGLTLDHSEEAVPEGEVGWEKLLVPEQLAFVSYPYEWAFDQLKDAALLTLEIQERALRRGFSLKDASPYNVQFRGSRPVFIDTLSFQPNLSGTWIAYEQFCRQFLGPLVLMSFVTYDASKYLKAEVNGFPLDLVSRRLPKRSYLSMGPLLHIHLHARSVRRGAAMEAAGAGLSGDSLRHLIASLKRAVEGLRRPVFPSSWTGYYDESRFYTAKARESKRNAVRWLASEVRPGMVFDLGANTGLFARDMAVLGAQCIAFDSDAGSVNALYVEERGRPNSRVLPLCMDLENPSPGLGFGLNATLGLLDRSKADLVLCLALIHHLRFTGNLPLWRIADFLSKLGRWLLLEHVPADDPAVLLLRNSRDGFDDYSLPGLMESFGAHYVLRNHCEIAGTQRALYLFERLK